MTEPTLDLCPLCSRKPDDVGWVDEQEQFLVDCPHCTPYTITLGMANHFRSLLEPDERRIVERLSRYLHQAGDDDDREVTEESWLRLAAEA